MFECDTEKVTVSSFCSWLIDNGYVFVVQYETPTHFRIVFQRGREK